MTTTVSRTRLDVRLTPARVTLIVGLVIAAAGVFTEFLAGVPGFPKVPPGPFILAAGAVVVMVLRWRWAPAIGLLVALFITVGTVLAGAGGRLTNPTPLGWFLGTWVQLIGLVIALVGGVLALVVAARTRRT
jgi:hypothetical protein